MDCSSAARSSAAWEREEGCGQQLRAAAADSTDSLHLHHLQWLVALAALQKPPHASKG